MNCEREIEVLDAVMSGRWPEGCDDEVRAHAMKCKVCVDYAGLVNEVRESHLAMVRAADVPPSGVVWFRAQRRARREAIVAAKRAIAAVQTGTIAAAIVIGLGVIGGVGALVSRIADGLHFGGIAFTPDGSVVVAIAAATLVLMAPVAVWVVVSDE